MSSALSLTIEEIEKQEEALRIQKEALLKQKQQSAIKDEALPSSPPKGTHKITILQGRIGDLVNESNPEDSSAKEQVDGFIAGVQSSNPSFNKEQLDRMRQAYEDAILEDTTAAKTTEGQPLDKKYLPDLKITANNTKPQTSISKDIKKFVKNKKDKSSSSNKDLKVEADKTLISLVVKPGDTLGQIALRNYGDASMYMAIFDANRDRLKSPHKVPRGITLRVPKLETASKNRKAKQPLSSKPKKSKKTNHRTYRNMAELERLIMEGKL